MGGNRVAIQNRFVQIENLLCPGCLFTETSEASPVYYRSPFHGIYAQDPEGMAKTERGLDEVRLVKEPGKFEKEIGRFF